MQALAPAAAFHDPARELVDDLDLALLHDVVDVALVERLRLERLHEVVDEDDVLRVVEVVDAERALDLLDRGLRRRDGLELLVVEEVRARELRLVEALRRLARRGRAVEVLGDASELVVGLRGGLRLAGDDERRPRLVDEDRVDLVHDRVGVAALDDAVERDGHVVAQVVEAELGVRPVHDVARVRLAALRERHEVLDGADGAAEQLVHGLRPLRVALREVVVHRHEMDSLAGETVEIERLHGDERLPLARLHLGDVALVEDDPAHELDVEEPHADRAPEGLAHRGVGLEDQVLERLAVLEALLELGGLSAELVVGELLEVGLERADVRRLLGEALDAPPLAHAKDALELPEGLRRHGPRVPARPGNRAVPPASQDRYRPFTRGSHAASLASGRMDASQLETIPLFAELTLDQRASVASVCDTLEVEEGTVLVREGDFGHAVFAITSGTADVVHEGAVINTLGPGDYFGEIAVMSGGRRSASVVATSPLTLVTIFNREIWRLEREAPEIAAVLREHDLCSRRRQRRRCPS